ncbi:ArsR/SmtB family transcription factor [Microbacterium sp. P02]|uniref:ArsR/SmtB family transcription factor n=1 Tax=Microbacterium sp. P02 TaxID=3366260 RepID=UPI0036712D3A
MVVETELELDDGGMDRIFRALADATRRDILRRTMAAEQSVSLLAAAYDMSFAAVQKHVAVLETAHLIVKRAEGRERLVRANPATIARARQLLGRYEELWRSRVDRLDALLAEGARDRVAPDERPAHTRPADTGTDTGTGSTDTRSTDPGFTDS